MTIITNIMDYKIKTHLLEGFDQNEVITETSNDRWGKPNPRMGDPYIHRSVIKRNPRWFEEVKPEPEEGAWLKSASCEDMIVRVDEFKEWGVNGGMIATGINGFGEWTENHQFGTHHCRRATDEEVEQALTKEAEKRGFGTGIILSSETLGFKPGKKKIENDYVEYEEDRLFLGGQCVYRQGEWAEIIKDEWEVEQMPFPLSRYKISNGHKEIILHQQGIDTGFKRGLAEKIADSLNSENRP